MTGAGGVKPRPVPWSERDAKMTLPDLRHFARPGQEIALRVTPRAASNRIEWREDGLRAYVTVMPEDGKANAAVQKLLAKAIGLPKSRLRLLRGQTARDKVFVVS